MKKTVTVVTLWQWKALEYLAYITIIAIPLVAPRGHIFAFTGLKSFLTLGVVSIMLILYVWSKWREIQQDKGQIRLTWLHGALLFFTVVLGLSAMLGVDPQTSWFGTFQEGTGLVYIYSFVLWSILIGTLVRRNKKFLVPFIIALFTGGVIATLFILFGRSTIGNSSFEGAYLLFIACFGIVLFIYYEKFWQRIVMSLALLLVLFSPILFNSAIWKGEVSLVSLIQNPLLLFGEANGASIGLCIAISMMIGLFATRSRQQYKRIFGLVLCTVTIVSVVTVGYQLITPGTSINTSFIEQKTASRFVYWDIARAGFLDRPYTGWGWGNYGAVYQQYFDPVLFSSGYTSEPALQDPHNAIWSYSSTTGIAGLLSYVTLLSIVLVALYRLSSTDDRKERAVGVVLAASIIGYFLQNMFIFDTPVSYLLLFSVIGIALGLTPGRWSIILDKKYNILYGVGGSIFIAVMAACVILFAALPWKESRYWFKHITEDSLSVAILPQSTSLVGNGHDTSYIASNFYQYSKEVSKDEKQKQFYVKKYQLLVNDLAYDIAKNQDNYKTYLVKGVIENGMILSSGKLDATLLQSAYKDLNRARELNPRNPESYFNLVQTFLYEKNFDQAYAHLRASIALAPTYEQGYSIANALLKVRPDEDFFGYIQGMKNNYINTN